MYCYIWEYEVRSAHVKAFETGYGPHGEWVQLFRRDPAYIRTDLFRDRGSPTRFLTIDYWASREACMAFRERVRSEFDAIDARYGQLTSRETHLGDYDVVETRAFTEER